MKILTTCLIVILSGATMLAQEVPPEGPRGPRRFRGQALHNHLQLTEEQVTALRGNQRALREATRPLMQQIREKKRQLREEMNSDAPNAGTIGQLNVEIKDIMGQIKTLREESRASAVANLDGSQQAALEELQHALELQRMAHQAVAANLVAAPEGSFGMGGPQRGQRGMQGSKRGPRAMMGPRARGRGHGDGPAPETN